MIRAMLILAVCMSLSSCETMKTIQSQDSLGGTLGSFRLNPVQENSYWYDGKSYEYNKYEIEMTSAPDLAIVQWNGKMIGTTPFVYGYTGTLDRDERVVIRAIPKDGNLIPQEAVFRVRTELPRKIHFDLNKDHKEKEQFQWIDTSTKS
jgi:hypothetical protein